jgi:BirA family biotin operon repressor/biotin-[acetyl-CoA-carboxylase] ligase
MTSTSHQVLQLLTSGEYVSGEKIGHKLGISRMAVSKAIKRLKENDVPVTSVSGRGYRLQRDYQLLDRQRMEKLLDQQGLHGCELHVLESVASTSDYLLDLDQKSGVNVSVCLTEEQAQGRGRRERSWVATPYRNIIMSIACQFENGMADLSGLGVVAGISIIEVLHTFGLDEEIGLKWPNDIVWQDRKLGGLLIDVKGEHDGPCRAVLGFGLNLSLSESDADALDQPFTTLEEIHDEPIDRNALIVDLIVGLAGMLQSYPSKGISHWHEAWQFHDRLYQRPVTVIRGDESIIGTALGINEQGGLMVSQENGEAMHFYSGEVSLRIR